MFWALLRPRRVHIANRRLLSTSTARAPSPSHVTPVQHAYDALVASGSIRRDPAQEAVRSPKERERARQKESARQKEREREREREREKSPTPILDPFSSRVLPSNRPAVHRGSGPCPSRPEDPPLRLRQVAAVTIRAPDSSLGGDGASQVGAITRSHRPPPRPHPARSRRR